MIAFHEVQTSIGDFGHYQLRLFLATQLGYLAIAGSMLCTTFDTALPNGFNCTSATQTDIANASALYWLEMDFQSLLLEWQLLCSNSFVTTFFEMVVMLGGVFGAFFWGYSADRFGRKTVVVGTMAGVAVLNGLIAAMGAVSWVLTAFLFFILGFFGGGYMATNLVFTLEAVGTQYWRVSVVAFHGWPLGMMFMAGLGYATHNWRWFHLSLATIALIMLVPLLLVTKESARWLLQHGRTEECNTVLAQIAKMNGKAVISLQLASTNLVRDKSTPVLAGNTANRSYTYTDLLRHKSVYTPLMALLYSWFASSIISYGIYFNLDVLPGDRFIKTLLTGLFKGIAGTIPFFLNHCVGRRPIFLASAALVCSMCWAVVAVYFFSESPNSILLTVFTIMGAAAIDPMWKVNHLYSTELFPTVVRNMACAVCNVGSRVGSVIAPSIIYLRHYNFSLPYIVFGCTMLVQIMIGTVYLPETKNCDLPDKLPDDEQDDLVTNGHAVEFNFR